MRIPCRARSPTASSSDPRRLTYAVIRERIDDIALASDEEIVAAMRFLFERLKPSPSRRAPARWRR